MHRMDTASPLTCGTTIDKAGKVLLCPCRPCLKSRSKVQWRWAQFPMEGERARLVDIHPSEVFNTLLRTHKVRWFQKHLNCWSSGLFFPDGIAKSNRRHHQHQPPAELSALTPKHSNLWASPHNSRKFSCAKHKFPFPLFSYAALTSLLWLTL